ncbi:QacE family quaternary ammonium compound efflux SMR transporter [Mycolicibacterium sp. P9-64]|uniref:DMT family transporter n=1 Tax=Mycolicibacterium sp. P9-64 TaxID=2024612 RepID=UPI0011ED33F4|nr:SMR family transporter [Mycolicibacterium sp. P9-64]KAA0084787.1 QacE family quaternary ammonium compound efflux SMR transporter [Mycolicibacterium sp. P9-64]
MWLALAGAIAIEVVSTLLMRTSSATGNKFLLIPVIVGYALSFALLTVCLSRGMPVGIAYGIWTACGVALVAILAKFLFKEPLTWLMGVGICCIIVGVLTIEMLAPTRV